MVKQISPWDVELEILAPSFEEYNQTIRELTKEFSECIQNTETAIMTHDEIWPAGAAFLQ